MQLTHNTDTGAQRLELVPFAVGAFFRSPIIQQVIVHDEPAREVR